MTDASKLRDLEDRLDQMGEAIVVIGRLLSNELGSDSCHAAEKVREGAQTLAQDYAVAGKVETARLLSAFHNSIEKRWSFLEWLDKKYL